MSEPNNCSVRSSMSESYCVGESSSDYWDVPADEEGLKDMTTHMSSTSANETRHQTKCEIMYGPYPQNYPIPYRKEGHPHVLKTKPASMWDIPLDYRDIGGWIPRDHRLFRVRQNPGLLAEGVVQNHAFITPSTLHFVSNHFHTPRLEWKTYQVKLSHANKSDCTYLSMDQILSFTPKRELPVTLASSNLRKQEMSTLKHTRGVPGYYIEAIGTQVYKGVTLRAILKHTLNITTPDRPTQFLQFIGADGFTRYLRLAYCINPANDVLLAYLANSDPLLPDHGYPLRLVVPGYVASYSVKWLKEIRLVHEETLPNELLLMPPSLPIAPNPMYGLREANIQCVILNPTNRMTLPFGTSVGQSITISGYAYSGGGRAITRVELSLDKGASWELVSDILRNEKCTAHQKYWCWIFWTHDVEVASLIPGSTEIWCRAWDSANNVQFEKPTWNPNGIGCNHVYSLRTTSFRNLNSTFLRMNHPVAPNEEGWLSSLINQPYSAGFGPLLQSKVADNDDDDEEALSTEPAMSETVSKLASPDLTSPQENKSNVAIEIEDFIESFAERDWLSREGSTHEDLRENINLSSQQLDEGSVRSEPTRSVTGDGIGAEDEEGNTVALHPKRRIRVELKQKTVLAPDKILLEFALPTPHHLLGLPIGNYVLLCAEIEGEQVIRRYTPISSNHDRGIMQLLIKVYRPNSHFRRGGKMSQYLDNLEVGDTIIVRGPRGSVEYLDNGNFNIRGTRRHAAKLNMIAGGSGITPLLQIAAHILRNPGDSTQMSLIYACRVEEDLLMRGVLDQWAILFDKKFSVHYILSESWPAGWNYSTGFVGKELFQKHLFGAGDQILNLICGPPIMVERGCLPNLIALGHNKASLFVF